MSEFPFKPAENAEAAQWLVERLTTFGDSVLSIVPSGLEAYARVFHPAEKVTYTSPDWANWKTTPIRWAEVAALTGRTAHRMMQWPSLAGRRALIEDEGTLDVGDVWVGAPEMGSLPLELAQVLWPLLEPYTTTRNKCFFAVWNTSLSHEAFFRDVMGAAAFETPGRDYYLLEAPLSHLAESFYSDEISARQGGAGFVAFDLEPGQAYPSQTELEAMVAKVEDELNDIFKDLPPPHQSANLLWPEDRSGCVHTEIDFNTTYIAGTQALIDDLLACEALEVYQIEPLTKFLMPLTRSIQNRATLSAVRSDSSAQARRNC